MTDERVFMFADDGLTLFPSVEDAAAHMEWVDGRVAVKCGYQAERTARSSVLHADGWHDMHLHGRINQDLLHPNRRRM